MVIVSKRFQSVQSRLNSMFHAEVGRQDTPKTDILGNLTPQKQQGWRWKSGAARIGRTGEVHGRRAPIVDSKLKLGKLASRRSPALNNPTPVYALELKVVAVAGDRSCKSTLKVCVGVIDGHPAGDGPLFVDLPSDDQLAVKMGQATLVAMVQEPGIFQAIVSSKAAIG